MESKSFTNQSNWNLNFPPALTKEELLLKSKYAELRKLKELFQRNQSTEKSISQAETKKVKTTIKRERVNQTEINLKKSSDFKKSVKQLSEKDKRRSGPVYAFDDDSQPRSVNIRGKDLTDKVLTTHFNKYGDILKIRINEEKTCSVLTYKCPVSAKLAVQALNDCTVEGEELYVSIPKRKNTSWCSSGNSPCKISDILNKGRSVHLSYKGHLISKDIEDFFQNVGRITRIYLSESKRFGFVTFENEVQAQRAIKEMNGEIYKGVRILVSQQKFFHSDAIKENNSPVRKEERPTVSYAEVDI